MTPKLRAAMLAFGFFLAFLGVVMVSSYFQFHNTPEPQKATKMKVGNSGAMTDVVVRGQGRIVMPGER